MTWVFLPLHLLVLQYLLSVTLVSVPAAAKVDKEVLMKPDLLKLLKSCRRPNKLKVKKNNIQYESLYIIYMNTKYQIQICGVYAPFNRNIIDISVAGN